jgi:hypothetical protein
VTEIVQADRPQARLLGDALEATSEVARLDRPACLGGQDQPRFHPRLTRPATREHLPFGQLDQCVALNRTEAAANDGLTCDEERIRRWERGEVLWPHPPYRKALQELTGRSAEQLGFLPPSKQRERRLITAKALPRDALRAEAELFDTMELARMADVSDIGPGTVEAVQEAVELLCRAYANTSALTLRDRTKQRLKYVLNLLGGRLTLSQHREILVQAGWLAALLGCLHVACQGDGTGELPRGRDHRALLSSMVISVLLVNGHAGVGGRSVLV